MNIVSVPRRRLLIAIAVAALLAGVASLLVLNRSEPAQAGLPPSQTICKGSVFKGEPDPDDPDATQVGYRFACSNAITGFQVQPDHQVAGFETELFALDAATKAVVPSDALNCTGELPGFGINCVGTYGGQWRVVSGKFSIAGKLCAEPRVDSLLTVVFAEVDSRGRLAQHMAGPFDLGRPQGCPKSARSGKTRIPKTTPEESTIEPAEPVA